MKNWGNVLALNHFWDTLLWGSCPKLQHSWNPGSSFNMDDRWFVKVWKFSGVWVVVVVEALTHDVMVIYVLSTPDTAQRHNAIRTRILQSLRRRWTMFARRVWKSQYPRNSKSLMMCEAASIMPLMNCFFKTSHIFVCLIFIWTMIPMSNPKISINQSINQSRMNSPLTNEVCLNTISFVIQWLTKVFHDCQVYLGQTSFAHHQQPLCVCYVGHGRVTQLIDLNCQSDKYDIYYKYYVQFSWFISIISH